MKRTQKILLVDSHPAVRIGVRQVLKKKFEPVLMDEAEDIASVYAKLNEQDWDLVILEIHLPGRSGLELLQYIKSASTSTKALVYSACNLSQMAVRSIRAGAYAYIPKDSPVKELTEAVAASLRGKKYIQASVAGLLASEIENPHDTQPHTLLSDREFQTFIKLAQGKTPTQIARELHLSVSTVNTYRSRILRKMKLSGNVDIIRYAVRENLT